MLEPTGREGILVLHPGALGDVLQAVPALRALGRLGRVTLAGQDRFAALLRDTGVSAEARSFDTLGLQALFTPDLPAPDALRRATLVVSWFGAADETFARRLGTAVPRAVLASPTGDADLAQPVWRHLLGTVAGLGTAPAPDDTAPLPIPPAWRERARHALAELGVDPGRPLLAVHPGAGGAWKRPPLERFAEVIERAAADGVQPLIHQGPADREAAERLGALLTAPAPRLLEPDLPLLAAVLADAAGYLGGDSGVSQLAAAVGAAGVILYPRQTRERWEPWSPSALAFVDDGDPGRPAEIAGRLAELVRLSGLRTGRPGASRPSSRASP